MARRREPGADPPRRDIGSRSKMVLLAVGHRGSSVLAKGSLTGIGRAGDLACYPSSGGAASGRRPRRASAACPASQASSVDR